MSADPESVPPLPDEAEALGPAVKVYPAALAEQLVFLLLGLGFAGVAGYGLFRILLDRAAAGFLEYLACCAAPLGALFCALWYRRLGLRVLVHEHGFVHCTNRSRQVFRWVEIVSLRKRANIYRMGPVFAGRRKGAAGGLAVSRDVTLSGATHTPSGIWRCAVRTVNGRRVELNNSIANVHALIHHIEDRVYPRLFAKCSQAMEEGQTVSFGAFTLSPEGIGCDGKLLCWAEVASVDVEVDGGIVRVTAQGRWLAWAKKKVQDVQNLPVFLRLARELQESVGTRPSAAKKPKYRAGPCPSCGAVIPPKEIAAGWCEACGKAIPRHVVRQAGGEED
jgi:hypothetical protein